MANILSALKQEIARVARKELRTEIDGLRKSSARYRSDIAALKRRIAELEQLVTSLSKQVTKAEGKSPANESTTRARFSAKGLRTHRERLDLSAADVGRMMNVSPQTIYNWEAGTTRPRPEQIAAIAALRKLGKREVRAILDQIAG